MRNIPVKSLIVFIALFFMSLPSFAENSPKKERPWTVNELKLKEEDPKYEITCRFPQFKESLGKNVEPLNKKIESLIKERVTESKNNYSKRESNSEMPSSLDIGFSVYRATKNLVSVVFNVENYSAGAAHPNHWTQSLTYDLSKGRFLKLGTILKNDSKYLSTVSKLCVADLKNVKSLDQAWVMNGAGPKAENFQTFYLDKDSLAIIFDEYKVGPYSAGAQSVSIPYSKLKESLNPDLKLIN